MVCIRRIHFVLLTSIAYAFPLDTLVNPVHEVPELIDVTPNQHTGDLVKEWEHNMHVNPEELGNYYEGDIMVDDIAIRGDLQGLQLWNGAIVPYEITGNFGIGQAILEWAIDEYHEKTCIRFVPRQPEDLDYITISNEETGCWSHVGRQGGHQEMNLQYPGCLSEFRRGSAIHELMHVLGIGHEHTRSDRDDYVTILFENIKQDRAHNFDKDFKHDLKEVVPYDFGSLMHYSMYAFSIDHWNRPTLRPKITEKLLENTDFNFKMGQRVNFSALDVVRLNRLYCEPDPVGNALDYISRIFARKHKVKLDLIGTNVTNTV